MITSYTDGGNFTESVASPSSVAVVNVNDPPTGSVTITGVAREDETLTANNTLDDDDGLGPISYRWQRATSANDVFKDIFGASNPTYTLVDDDTDMVVRVVASYTDGNQTLESASSSATSAVINVNDAPSGAVSYTHLTLPTICSV